VADRRRGGNVHREKTSVGKALDRGAGREEKVKQAIKQAVR
jgi:hypothetical protein